MDNTTLVSITGLSKRFGKVTALNNVQFELKTGEVHALLGENGAGKSTLIKVISGVHTADDGEMRIKGQLVKNQTPKKARDSGIATVFQELSLVNELTVEDNIFLGRAPVGFLGALDRAAMHKKAQELLDYVGVDATPQTKVGSLGSAQQQLVEIAKALSTDPDIIIMDEPTDKLYGDEQEHLYTIIRKLRAEGKGIIYISHKLEELMLIADRITVLRDAQYISTIQTADTNPNELISMMVGRSIQSLFPKESVPIGGDVLTVQGLNYAGFLRDINFTARSGEILGIGGLVGSGRTMLAQCIAGVLRPEAGRVLVDGREVVLKSPKEAIRSGIAYLPEDRKRYGLVMSMSCLDNIVLPSLDSFVLDKAKLTSSTEKLIKPLNVKTPSIYTQVDNLSGGNQQKVVIAKWLSTKARVFIFDEPTQGIDVGTKAEIYKLMNGLVREGCCIVMISSDMNELLSMSDRVAVMSAGRLVDILDHDECTQENVLRYAFDRAERD